MRNCDFTSIWLQVSGVIVPAPVADFLLSYLQWVSDGSVGDFQVGPPCGWDPADLCTLAFLVANKEVSSAQQLMDSLPSPPRVMLPSGTLIDANDNHLKHNPFRRRRSRKHRILKVDADAGIENQDLQMGDCDDGNKDVDCNNGDAFKVVDNKDDEEEGGGTIPKQDLLEGDDSKGSDVDDDSQVGDEGMKDIGKGRIKKPRSVRTRKTTFATIRIPTLRLDAKVRKQILEIINIRTYVFLRSKLDTKICLVCEIINCQPI